MPRGTLAAMGLVDDEPERADLALLPICAVTRPSDRGWFVVLYSYGQPVDNWRWTKHTSTRWGARRAANKLIRRWHQANNDDW